MTWDSRAAIGALWLLFGLVWAVAAFGNKRTAQRQPRGSLFLHMCVLALAFNLLFGDLFRRGFLRQRFVAESEATGWIGFALALAGVAFAIWARFHIGRNWSGTVTLKEGHTLVRSGPYALVRHPIYTGILLAALGTALNEGQVRCLIGLAVMLIEFKRKSLLEERLMIEQFGAEYISFRRDVKGLVPFVW